MTRSLLAERASPQDIATALAEMKAVRVSARTGEGLAELCALLVKRLVPDPPPSRTAAIAP